MEVDTNELLRRIGAVLRVISDKMDRLIEIGERVEGQVRLPSEEESKTVADVLMDDACIPSDAVAEDPPKKWRILEPGEVVQEGDWMNAMVNPQEDGPPDGGWLAAPSFYFGKEASFYFRLHFARPVATEPAKEPPKKWRILEPGEVVCSGDRVNAKTNPPSDPPNGSGWLPAGGPIGLSVLKDDEVIFARPVADEPTKDAEPGHPAGPMPDPGEGYRLVSKNPPEGLQPGDEYRCRFHREKQWIESSRVREGCLNQLTRLWYRRKIEVAEPPEPEYRKPVLPADCGKWCEFSDDSISWEEGDLIGWRANLNTFNWESGHDFHRYARIKKDA